MRQLKITPNITNRTPCIEKYFAEVERHSIMITSEREQELARRIKSGDAQAEQELVKANLRFVISVAKKYANRGISLEDLINEGNIGLIKAAKKFDETRGFKFISYAVWWIRQSILESFGDNLRNIRLPLNVLGKIEKIKKFSVSFEQKNHRQPSTDEISIEFGIHPEELRKLYNHSGSEFSLDSKPKEDEDSTFAEMTPSGVIQVYDNAETDSLKNFIKESMYICLTQLEREIIVLFFGLNPDYPLGMGVDEIGARYSLSGERIRQIKEKSLRKIRNSKKCREMYENIK